MKQMLLVEQEVTGSRAANYKKMKKRHYIKNKLQRDEGLFVHEALEQGIGLPGGIEGGGESSAPLTRTVSATGDGTNRRQYTCNICRRPGHRANRCTDRVLIEYKGVVVV